MHVQIVSFSLTDEGEEEYCNQGEPIAPAFAGLPGLVSKTWLANPHFDGVTGRDFAVLERPTRVTRGMAGTPTPATQRT